VNTLKEYFKKERSKEGEKERKREARRKERKKKKNQALIPWYLSRSLPSLSSIHRSSYFKFFITQ
jgi:transposase